jgi:hypothetical protein
MIFTGSYNKEPSEKQRQNRIEKENGKK